MATGEQRAWKNGLCAAENVLHRVHYVPSSRLVPAGLFSSEPANSKPSHGMTALTIEVSLSGKRASALSVFEQAVGKSQVGHWEDVEEGKSE